MKKVTTTLLLASLIISMHAQLLPNYAKTIPAFNIQLSDGSYFKASNLKIGQPLMLVYFDPDCDHCAIFTRELLKKLDAFSHVQIVMVTYVPVKSLKQFINEVGLQNYPQIKAGTEGTTFVVRYHYNIMQFPYIALHDQNGMLMATYESEVPTIETLAEKLRK